jgi:putative PIN family toxin of toxin-antitoxin system
VRRITLDANVLAPGFTSQSGASARLLDHWRAGRFELILSEHVLEELARALADPYFAALLPPGEDAAILTSLNVDATLTELTVPVVSVATHPEDDLVLSTALSGQASILCTRDKQLLKLRSYQSVDVLSPGELLARLESEALAKDITVDPV